LLLALSGDTRLVDGVTFLGHAVVGGVLFVRFLFAIHLTYIETCWYSTQLLDTRTGYHEQKSPLANEETAVSVLYSIE
jgi:hypothetical protein